MQVAIVDPVFRAALGHFVWHVRLAEEMVRRGASVTIFGRRDCGDTQIEGVRTFPVFTPRPGTQADADKVLGPYNRYVQRNRTVEQELRALPPAAVEGIDLLLVMTPREDELTGIAAWIHGLHAHRPRFVLVELMHANGMSFTPQGVRIGNSLKALLFRRGVDAIRACGARAVFGAMGEEHVQSYRALSGIKIVSLPVVLGFPEAMAETPVRPGKVQLFIGGARGEKGIRLLPAAVELLATEMPDSTFAVDISDPGGADLAPALAELGSLADRLPNFELHLGPMDPRDYGRRLAEGEVIVLPYDRSSYLNRTSGVLWEAVYLGRSVIVPEDCWIEREAGRLGASYATTAARGTASYAAELLAILRSGRLDPKVAMAAGERFRAANGLTVAADYLDRVVGIPLAGG